MPDSERLIPLAVQYALRDAVGGWGPYTVNEIVDLFTAHGFRKTATPDNPASGQRRTQAEEFHAAINWRSAEECERYLRLMEDVLEELGDADPTKVRLLKALKRADVVRDEKGRLRLPAKALEGVNLANLTKESDIRLHVGRLTRLDQEPEEMIGAAKDLVEATAKHVLLEFGQPIPPNADIPGLSKAALALLSLHPTSIAPTAKGAEIMIRLLGGLAQVAVGLAELRNLGYGVGHGTGRRVGGLRRRHGEFAARAATAYVQMVLDTLHDPEAPWRKGKGVVSIPDDTTA